LKQAEPSPLRLISQEFSALAAESEHLISKIAIAIAAASFLLSLTITANFQATLGMIISSVSLAFGLYHVILLRWREKLRRHIIVIRIINVTIEVSLPTLVILLDAHFMGSFYALTSTPPYLTFIAVMASGLRFSYCLAVSAGCLGAIEYMALYFIISPGLPQNIVNEPTFSLAFAVNHSIYILCAGLVAMLVAHVARYTISRIARQVIEKERIRHLFGEYIAPEALSHVLSEGISLQGERRVVTVLFADIRGFTDLSYKVNPEQIVAYLNSYFGSMCDVIGRNGGMVNKFIGDGLLAVFGAPQNDPYHTVNAMLAARNMLEAACLIPRPDGQSTQIGVSLHTGDVVLGNIGSTLRKDYTVIGDTVNLASRIQSLCVPLGETLLISEDLARQVQHIYQLRNLGEHQIKGRTGRVRVFGVAADKDDNL